MSSGFNPVLHSELSQICIHSTLYETLKKYYLSKAEIPTFKRLVGYHDYIEPNKDLFRELQSLLEILDMYRKTETLKNEQKLQFVQDRYENKNGDLFFKKKILDHLQILLDMNNGRDGTMAPQDNYSNPTTINDSDSYASAGKKPRNKPDLAIVSGFRPHSDSEHTVDDSFTPDTLNPLLRKIHNIRWRSIIRDIYASRNDQFSIVPKAKRLMTPRSDESRSSSVSSSSSSRSVSSSHGRTGNVFYKSIFLVNDFDELDLEAERHNLKVDILMQDNHQDLLDKLRQAFLMERKMLTDDVDYIRNVLDNESDFNHRTSNFIFPTSQELSEVEQHLSEMVENHYMQARMEKIASSKVSKLITPRKAKLPSHQSTLSPSEQPNGDSEGMHERRKITPVHGALFKDQKDHFKDQKDEGLDKSLTTIPRKRDSVPKLERRGSIERLQTLTPLLSKKSGENVQNLSKGGSTNERSTQKLSHRTSSSLKTTQVVPDTTSRNQELHSFLSENSSSSGRSTTQEESSKRKRPSTASRLRNAVLSNRMES